MVINRRVAGAMGNPRQLLGSSRANPILGFDVLFIHLNALKEHYFGPQRPQTFFHCAFWTPATSFGCHLAWITNQYVVIIVCVFSGWGVAFPCGKADALTVRKGLEHMFPTRGMSFTISSDGGTHLTGQIIQAWIKRLANFLASNIRWNSHWQANAYYIRPFTDPLLSHTSLQMSNALYLALS